MNFHKLFLLQGKLPEKQTTFYSYASSFFACIAIFKRFDGLMDFVGSIAPGSGAGLCP
jgi:hypothetical protein